MTNSVSNEGAAVMEPKHAPAGRRRSQASDVLDRLPPYEPAAEAAVLSCVLVNPNECLAECLECIKAAEYFYDLRHQFIFSEMVRMHDERVPIDIISLTQRLRDAKRLEDCGGFEYLAPLPEAAPSTANLSYYLEIVKEKFLLRKMVQVCTDVVSRVYDHTGDVDELLDGVERDVLRINEARASAGAASIKDLVKGALMRIEEFHQRQGALTGIGTGFTDLDKLTSGLHPGEMIVIAARPSMGKTSLAMNIAEYAALEQKLPVGVFSLEMTAESLVLRTVCSRARVNLRNLRDGFLAERDFAKIGQASGRLANAPLFIDDSSGLSILQLRARARRMAQQHGIKLFVVDYLQLLNSTNRRSENRQQEIADISSGLKALAKELQVPVVVLSQLNREIEKDKGRRPRMSDLRESGAIEQDADLVGLLYKPAKDEDEEENDHDAIAVNLLIAKQRNGPTGEVNLTFLKSYTRFESATRLANEEQET